jgi:hypothetical protein
VLLIVVEFRPVQGGAVEHRGRRIEVHGERVWVIRPLSLAEGDSAQPNPDLRSMKTTAVRVRITTTPTRGDEGFTGTRAVELRRRSSPGVEQVGEHAEHI